MNKLTELKELKQQVDQALQKNLKQVKKFMMSNQDL